MVPNSSIGVRHPGLMMAEFGKQAMVSIYSWLTDPVILVYFFKIILSAATDSYIVNTQNTTYIIIDLIIILSIKGLLLGFMYYQTKTFPNNWIGGSIKKMKKIKEDTYKWKDTKLTQIQVGDIVRLRYEQVSPFDILILDTSELRYNDNILNINEGTIRGDNRVLVKRSIRNLGVRSPTETTSSSEYLLNLARKLSGYVEYDAPTGGIEHFNGMFKLKNDPKVANFTEEHMILCGAKVYSKEAVGMVLFTGSNTRIFQKSSVQSMGTHVLMLKRSITQLYAHKIAFLLLVITFFVSVAVFVLGMAGDQSKAILNTIEANTVGYSSVKKFLAIWTSLVNAIPGALIGIPDLYCLYVGVRLRKNGLPAEMFSHNLKDGQLNPNSLKLGQKGRIRDVRRAKIGTLGRAAPANELEVSSKQIEIVSLRRMSNTMDSTSPRVTRRDTKRFENGDSKSGTGSNINIKPVRSELNDKNFIRILNCNVLPDLGYIDQVFFDKTDTLTSGKMKVAEISTYQKCYEIPSKDFNQMINECTAQPDLYAYEDENAANKESGDYSEKSQE